MSDDGTFSKHINKVIAKAKQKIGWVTRTFIRNNIEFNRLIWRTYIQSTMDYGSQVWAPIDSTNIMKLENILKSFSRNIDGLQDKNYWERLKKLKVNSIQRRMERYRILYIWKTITGKVPNYGLK